MSLKTDLLTAARACFLIHPQLAAVCPEGPWHQRAADIRKAWAVMRAVEAGRKPNVCSDIGLANYILTVAVYQGPGVVDAGVTQDWLEAAITLESLQAQAPAVMGLWRLGDGPDLEEDEVESEDLLAARVDFRVMMGG